MNILHRWETKIMRNRAKCKLCHSIIESYHDQDFVVCNCGHCSVSGGAAMYCGAVDWATFVRVDDLGNEIVPIIKEKPLESDISSAKPDPEGVFNRKEKAFEALNYLKQSLESLPTAAMHANVTNYDLLSLVLILSAL